MSEAPAPVAAASAGRGASPAGAGDVAEATPPPAPGKPSPEQLARTVQWATSVFQDFYRREPPPMPARHGRREFGFIPAPRPAPEPTPFFRHMAMRSRDELREYLAHRGPWHCYYSTAYYEKPSAPTMKEKNWLGADLIFDLDADHLKGAETMSFEEQLVSVRRQAKRLVDDFLVPDFGFDTKDMRVVFSGGRGYHIHVVDERVRSLGSAERREIVDYISPPEKALDDMLDSLETTHAFSTRLGRTGKEGDPTVLLPPADAPGWRGKFTRYAVLYLRRLAAMPREDAVKELCTIKNPETNRGIGPKGAESILGDITEERLLRIEQGRIEAAPAVRRNFRLLRMAFRDQVLRFAPGETDEPVTADIKRLIRMPGSLHGKTGLRVTPIGVDRLADFDPLAEAVALGDAPVKVVVSKPEAVRLGGETITPKPGLNELPLRHAAFLVLRRRALLA